MVQHKFAPPRLRQRELCELVLEEFESHRACNEPVQLLVGEYWKLWWMRLEHTPRRIVGPGPLIAVQRIHRHKSGTYLEESVSYFGSYIDKELAWRGENDALGTVDTMRAYRLHFKEDPPSPWWQMLNAYERGGSALRIVVNNT